ncbi:hypothetical protein SUZIE_203310 [Sciurus carolinensis]|uniref:Uncharacterized protein n=1 Tax=Sciurus carolinensis TaxID=30640 RepID=A0AA41NGN3_SCICA|nr:hypothetical protein [Sciurus carolinensis]
MLSGKKAAVGRPGRRWARGGRWRENGSEGSAPSACLSGPEEVMRRAAGWGEPTLRKKEPLRASPPTPPGGPGRAAWVSWASGGA